MNCASWPAIRGTAAEWAGASLSSGLIAGEVLGAGPSPACAAVCAAAAALLAFAWSIARARSRTWVQAALLLLSLHLLGWARGAEAARHWEEEADAARDCAGLAWVAAADFPGVAGGDARLSAVRPVRASLPKSVCFRARPIIFTGAGISPDEAEGPRPEGPWQGLARILPARPARFPGDWSEREGLRGEGLAARMRVFLRLPVDGTQSAPFCLPAGGRARHPLLDLQLHASQLRESWADAIARRFPGRAGSLAVGMVLGCRANAAQSADAGRALTRAGIGHLLAVSGLHVALAGACMLALLRVARVPGRARALVLPAGLLAYGSLVGWSPSVTRAVWVGVLWCALDAAKRRPRGRTLLLVVLGGNLWAHPAVWRNAGLQLSYLVSAAILGANASVRGVHAHVRVPKRVRRLWHAAIIMVAAQSAAWLLLLGLQGAASPCFLFSNLVLVPLSGLLLPVVLAAIALQALPGFPDAVALAPAQALLDLFLAVGERAAPLCDATLIHAPLPQGLAAALSLFVAALWQVRRLPPAARAAAALLAVTGITIAAHPPSWSPRIVMLDVGQGESWAIFWRRETWVIDAGPRPGAEGRARYCLGSLLRAHARNRIDRLFLTHDDSDHTGGIAEIEETGIPVARLHHPEGWHPGPRTATWMRNAEQRGTAILPLSLGDTLRAPEGTLAVLHPRRLRPEESGTLPGANVSTTSERGRSGLAPEEASSEGEKNARCLAFRLETKGVSLVICADAPADSLARWAQEGRVGEAQLLSAAHHGSDGSVSGLFLDRAHPCAALISVARENRFRLPGEDCLAALSQRAIPVFRTDEDGSIVIAREERAWTVHGYASNRRLTLKP